MAGNPSCFVIGPIGDRLAGVGTPERQVYEHAIQVWENVILPACEATGLKPLRADHISRSGEIVEQVCRHLRDADLVIADLTGANPNVMYELGLRHTISRPTIQIGERGRLPFDISAIRTLQFKRSESGFIDVRYQLVEAIKTALTEGCDPVTATRVWNNLPSDPHPANPNGDSCDAEEALGFLEKLAASEEGMETLRSVLNSMTATIARVTSLVESAVKQIGRSDARGGGARGRLTIVERLATQLNEQGATLEAQSMEFEACLKQAEPGVDYLLGQIESDLAPREQASAFIAWLHTLTKTAEENDRAITSLREEMKAIGGSSRSMRKAVDKLDRALGRQQRGMQRFQQWGDHLELYC